MCYSLQFNEINPDYPSSHRFSVEPISGKKCRTPCRSRLRITGLTKNPGHKRSTPGYIPETNVGIVLVNPRTAIFYTFLNAKLFFCYSTNLFPSLVLIPDPSIIRSVICSTKSYKMAVNTPTAANNKQTNDAK